MTSASSPKSGSEEEFELPVIVSDGEVCLFVMIYRFVQKCRTQRLFNEFFLIVHILDLKSKNDWIWSSFQKVTL